MTVAQALSAVDKFCNIWNESLAAVLGQLGVASLNSSLSEPIALPAPSNEELAKSVCVPFSGGGILRGALVWMTEKPSAVQLAQLLLSEPSDPAAEFTATHADAFAELLRQVAGHAASAWKRETHGETELTFLSSVAPESESGQSATFLLGGDKLSAVSLRLFLNAELCKELLTWKETPDASAPPVSPPVAKVVPVPNSVPIAEAKQAPTPSQNPASPGLPSNLDLLLDVQLDATIRFGERSMLLRDVFGLMPGAVVELNQQVNEPAELLVAGRLIARGEVVIVDGNFGLRVTNVVSPGQRAELLRL
jgi:flagellar motor switch protein FliN